MYSAMIYLNIVESGVAHHYTNLGKCKFTCKSFRNIIVKHYFVLHCFAAMQIIFILMDNVGMLFISCNIKKSNTCAKLSEKSRNMLRSNRFKLCSLPALILFLTVALQ